MYLFFSSLAASSCSTFLPPPAAPFCSTFLQHLFRNLHSHPPFDHFFYSQCPVFASISTPPCRITLQIYTGDLPLFIHRKCPIPTSLSILSPSAPPPTPAKPMAPVVPFPLSVQYCFLQPQSFPSTTPHIHRSISLPVCLFFLALPNRTTHTHPLSLLQYLLSILGHFR